MTTTDDDYISHEEMGKLLQEEYPQQCCGTTCDKALLEKQLKIVGAVSFLEYLEYNITEDCSEDALKELLHNWIKSI